MQVPPLGPVTTPWTAPRTAAPSSPDQVSLGREPLSPSWSGPSGLPNRTLADTDFHLAWASLPPSLGGAVATMALLGDLKARGFSFTRVGPKELPLPVPVKLEELAEELTSGPIPSNLQVSRPGRGDSGGDPFSQVHPNFRVFAPMNPAPMQVDRIAVSSFKDLKDLSSIARADFAAASHPQAAETFARLEQAGVPLLVSGPGYEPDQSKSGLMHTKMMVIGNDDEDPPYRPLYETRPSTLEPPKAAGAYGAHREVAAGFPRNVWLKGPQATEPTRLRSLEEAGFFYLGDPHPELDKDPLACQLRELERLGVQFLPVTRDDLLKLSPQAKALDAMAIYEALRSDPQASFHVALDGTAWTPAPRGADGLLQVGPDFLQAAHYRQEHLMAMKTEVRKPLLQALATPTGQTPQDKLALFDRLKTFHRQHTDPGHGTFFMSLTPSEVREAHEDMGRLARAGGPVANLVEPFLALRTDPSRSPDWLAGAVAHFQGLGPEHTEHRERLLELGKLRGNSFQDTLDAEAMLLKAAVPYPEALQAFQSLVAAFKTGQPLVAGTDAVGSALVAFPKLLQTPHPGQSLAQAAQALGSLIRRLGLESAGPVYASLQTRPGESAQIFDRFLREHHLSGEVDTALQCLEPGGHPALPEPLEVREAAEQLLKSPARSGNTDSLLGDWVARFDLVTMAFDDGQGGVTSQTVRVVEPSVRDYRFLVGLPNRRFPDDANTLAGLNQSLSSKDARDLMQEFKAGSLGRLTGPELLARLSTELSLEGDQGPALSNLRQPPAPFEQRQALAERLRSTLGSQEVAEDYKLLQKESLEGSSFDERLQALGRLRSALEPSEGLKACRQAYQAVVQSVREGAWTGRPLAEATDSFLKTYLSRDLAGALKALASGPEEPGQVAGVQVRAGSITVGGVRLRAPRLMG